jgi:probable HAF family extracellular repeat protein
MRRVALASAFSLTTAIAVASAQPLRYTVTEIPSPTAYGLRAKALNNNGQVVGSFAVDRFIDSAGTPAHAFLYSGGVVQDLFPGDSLTTFSEANAVNDRGQVVGDRRDYPNSYGRAFLHESGQVTMLNPFEFTPAATGSSVAYGISESGQIAGVAMTPEFLVHAFLQTPQIVPALDLNPDRTEAYFWSEALGVNAAGQVVGIFSKRGTNENGYDTQDTFFWDGQGFRYPDDLPGGMGFTPGAMNEAGRVAGFTTTSGWHMRAVVYDGTGITELASLEGATDTQGLGINAEGTVVGSAALADGTSRAVVWREGNAYDLNSLLASQPGVTLQEAAAVNDVGQIIAWGAASGSPMRSFLLTPAAPVTPSATIRGLIERVEALIGDGTLNAGQGNSLIGKLEQAIEALDQGRAGKATTMLEAFVHEVRAFRNARILEAAEADLMIAIAEAAIASI